MDRIPPLVRCPYCQPGAVMYVGRVLSVVCAACRRLLREAQQPDNFDPIGHAPRRKNEYRVVP